MKAYENDTSYYDDAVVQKNMGELKEKMTQQFEEIFKEQNEKQTKDYFQLVDGYLKRVMNDQKNNIQ